MKKLIYILSIIILSQSIYAQPEQDKLNHLTAGTMLGFAGSALTYQITEHKTLSIITGIGLSVLAGHLKEKYDQNHEGSYNSRDFGYTCLGGIAGSITIRLSLKRYVPRRQIPVECVFAAENTLQFETYIQKKK